MFRLFRLWFKSIIQNQNSHLCKLPHHVYNYYGHIWFWEFCLTHNDITAFHLIVLTNTCNICTSFTFQTKLSFAVNIVSFFWSITAVILCAVTFHFSHGVESKNIEVQGKQHLLMFCNPWFSLKHREKCIYSTSVSTFKDPSRTQGTNHESAGCWTVSRRFLDLLVK